MTQAVATQYAGEKTERWQSAGVRRKERLRLIEIIYLLSPGLAC